MEGSLGRKKRGAMDKNAAFVEFKDLGQGRQIEGSIVDHRRSIKDLKAEIRILTDTISATKREMDKVQLRLDAKGEEKAMQQKRGDFGGVEEDEGGRMDEIIDEEELMLLKEMKDLKKAYKENFHQLKNLKADVNSLLFNIDSLKQSLIANFEAWYEEEFE
mmetsp:Transcript_23266/g.17688  ORF Transcript_23266/g.17688 Transcript_23266/m.17688 type:complete len:161 (-) Transcript_23266:215-697(-)